MRGIKGKIVLGCVVIALGIFLNACAAFTVKPDEEILAARVFMLMDARVREDWAAAYELYAPSYKEIKTKEDFLNMNRKSRVVEFGIESIEIGPAGDDAKVVVKYSAKALGFEFAGIVNSQNWSKIDRTWYLQVDHDSSMKPFN